MITAAFSPGTYQALSAREALTAGMAGTSSAASITPRDGVIPDGVNPFAVYGTSGMNVAVQQGQAVLSGWVFTSDSAVSVALASAGSTARTDLIILRIQDAESGDSTSVATIERVTGTSTAVPALPSSRCLIVAQIAVAANTSSVSLANVTDRRVYTAASGGLIVAPGALATSPTVPVGQPVWDPAADRIGVATASGWRIFVPGDYVVPWTNLTLQSTFALPATGVTPPRLRRVNGKVEFSGSAYYAGTMPTTGALLSSSSLVAAAVPTTGSWLRIPICGMQGGTGGTYVPGFALRLLSNGTLLIDPPSSVTNVTVTLSGSIDDTSVG